MKVAVTGATGLVGSALVVSLKGAGHDVVPLKRPGDWNPEAATVNPLCFRNVDALVHLAGENIAAGRWTPARKARIRESRLKGTRLLAETMARLERRPAVFICASAIGYYGDRGSETLTEESNAGDGFLADVCKQWEAATEPAAQAGIRVVQLRTGIVLSGRGGALAKMLLPFKIGIGGKIGSGSQYWSWISLEDACRAIQHLLQAGGVHGAVNLVSPTPVTNVEFTRALGRALGRPAVLPLPAIAAKVVLGEMADPMLLASAKVEPSKLVASGFVFRYKDLEAALKAAVRREM
jgi:uncharacterized protein (TIGR01777 family)